MTEKTEDEPIYKSRIVHDAESAKPYPTEGDWELIKAVGDHVDLNYGKGYDVFHEITSEYVHVDVFRIGPTSARPYWTLITCGMAQLPMHVDKTIKNPNRYRYAELTLCLPETWPMSEQAWDNPTHYWPIGMIKTLALYPHKCKTWFWLGHSIPSGNSIPGLEWKGIVFLEPALMPESARTLKVNTDKTISFMGVFPMFEEEMNFKLRAGVDELEEAFKRQRVTELVDVKRANVITGERPSVS